MLSPIARIFFYDPGDVICSFRRHFSSFFSYPDRTIPRGHVCWDEHDLIDGRPTGLVRVSLGWMSTWEDVNAFASFVSKHFVVRKPLEVILGLKSF